MYSQLGCSFVAPLTCFSVGQIKVLIWKTHQCHLQKESVDISNTLDLNNVIGRICRIQGPFAFDNNDPNFLCRQKGLHGCQGYCSKLTTKTKLNIVIVVNGNLFNSLKVVAKCEWSLTAAISSYLGKAGR